VRSIPRHLSYANVVSTIALILVLGGATAMAATHLGKNSVGTKQLKNDAVTAAKIRDGQVASEEIGNGAVGGDELANGAVSSNKIGKGAVTGDKLADGSVTGNKISNGAVTGDKLADGSVRGEKIDLPTTPFSRVVQRIQGTSSIPFATVNPAPYPLENPTYIQPAGEVDQYVASFQVTFAAGCGGRRSATANLEIEPGQGTNPVQPVALGTVEDEHAGEVTRTAQFSGTSLATYGFATAAPASPTPHTFSVRMIRSTCTTGSGVTMDGAQVDVIGTR
jgi:hypothetical protein